MMGNKRLQISSDILTSLKDYANQDIIVSTYFISKSDPQTEVKPVEYRCRPNDITYISSWIATSLFNNLKPILIVDEMNEELNAILNQKGVLVLNANLGEMSTNDERFFCYLELLELNIFKRLLFTDVSDVLIKKNPFEFTEIRNKLCLGVDIITTPKVGNNKWIIHKIQQLINLNNNIITIDKLNQFVSSPLVNAGVIGGPTTQLKKFIEDICNFLISCPNEGNWNMVAVNYAASNLESDQFFAGLPFTSKFKQFNYEFDGFIVHK